MRGRFAPSPTGTLHLGNLRTAMLAWLFARSQGSTFALRFEDLDDATVRPEYYAGQRTDLRRLGIDWDDELSQRDHLDRYRDALSTLEGLGATYRCYCSRREIREAASAPHGPGNGLYPGTCRDMSAADRRGREAEGRLPAIRLRSTGEPETFVDRLCGETTGAVDDVVLARRDGVPAYNLVVVVDDAHQDIEEVVRADDLLPTTPAHLVIGRLLGVPRPAYAHVPLVLGPDGGRLAKRDGAVTLDDRLDRGESMAQIRGWLARSAGLEAADPAPTMPELAATFDPADVLAEPWTMSDATLH